MALTAAEVRSLLDDRLELFDDDYRVPGGAMEAWDDAQTGVLLSWVNEILDAYPHLTTRFDYGWARDRASYRTPYDLILQAFVLRLVAEVDPDHPHLAGQPPFAARVAINRDFVSTCAPSPEVNLVVLSRGFMDALKYFTEFCLDLLELEDRLPGEGGPAHGDRWGADRVDELVGAFREEVNAAVQRFALQTTWLSMESSPLSARPITARLLDGHQTKLVSYLGAESFVVAHEMGHVLRGHTPERKLHKEADADLAALSLSIASVGTERRMPQGLALTKNSIYTGIPLFFAVGRLFLTCGAATDRMLGRPERMDYAEGITEIDARRHLLIDRFPENGIPVQPLLAPSRGIGRSAGLLESYLHRLTSPDRL